IVLENDRLTLTRNEADAVAFIQTSKQGFTKPESTSSDVPFENAAEPHATMMQNFVDAILDHTPLIAPGEEGVNSVELANAIVFSSMLERTLDLPMDGTAWERKLNQLAAESTVQK